MPRSELRSHSIAAVIPAYRVAGQIAAVLHDLPPYLKHVIVVDDASTDGTAALVQAAARRDRRVILLRQEKSMGVGGAMLTLSASNVGVTVFRAISTLKGADGRACGDRRGKAL